MVGILNWSLKVYLAEEICPDYLGRPVGLDEGLEDWQDK